MEKFGIFNSTSYLISIIASWAKLECTKQLDEKGKESIIIMYMNSVSCYLTSWNKTCIEFQVHNFLLASCNVPYVSINSIESKD